MGTYYDSVNLIRYDDISALKPSRTSKYTFQEWSVDRSYQYGGYLLGDYTLSGSKPTHTVIRAAGTQQVISALDDIEERTLTLPMIFEPTNPKAAVTSQADTLQEKIAAWTKRLMNNGEPVRLKLGNWSNVNFVGRLVDISDSENILPDGTMQLITYTLKGYLSEGLGSTYHTSYTAGTIEGASPKIAAIVDFRKSASYSGVWVLGTRITGLTDYVYIRFDGVNKRLLAAKEPASGEPVVWENVMQNVEGFNGFPYLVSGESYKLGEIPAVGTAKNGSSTTSLVSAAITIYDKILI